MAQDMLNEIRRAEKESGEALLAARQAAQERVAEARSNALAAVQKAERNALTASEASMAETKKQNTRIARQASVAAEAACKSLSATADKNRESTIQRLLDALF